MSRIVIVSLALTHLIVLNSAAAQPPPPVTVPTELPVPTAGISQRKLDARESEESEGQELGFSIATEAQSTVRAAPARKGPAGVVNSGDEPSFGTDPVAR